MCICRCVCMYMYIYRYVYIYIHIHIQIYTNTYIDASAPAQCLAAPLLHHVYGSPLKYIPTITIPLVTGDACNNLKVPLDIFMVYHWNHSIPMSISVEIEHTYSCLGLASALCGCFILTRVWNRPVGPLCFIPLFHRYETDYLLCGSIGMEQKSTVGRLRFFVFYFFSKHPYNLLSRLRLSIFSVGARHLRW